jgi:hypothetical protein
MCGVAEATLIAGALSAGAGFVGQRQQAKAQAAQMNYQAAVNRNNAQIQNQLAEDALKRGEIEESEHRRKVNLLKGEQRVAYAGSGVDLGSDLVMDTLADTAQFGELDALTIRDNAEREAYGYRVGAMNYTASADLNQAGASHIKSAGNLAAVGSLLSDLGTTGAQYTEYKRLGVV